MTNRSAAIRYARALFDVALKERVDLARVDDDLAAFAALTRTHEALGHALLNPAIPAPRKRTVVAELTGRANAVPVVAKLLVLLAERDRLVILPELVAAFRERLLDHQRVVRAEVVTATPIAPAREQAIVLALEQATGRSVRMTRRVAPELIGGLVARVGGTVYDASVVNQLEKMRQRLTEGV